MTNYADLHCHPHLRSFNWLRESRFENNKEKFHPWHVVASRLKPKEKGKRANAYSQCDLIKLWNGRASLVFVSLYPMEKGWVTGRDDIPETVFRRAVKSLTNNRAVRWMADLNEEQVADFLVRAGKGKGPKIAFRDIVQGIFLKLPERRIQFLQKKDYDYFDELLKEREFLKNKNMEETEAEIFVPNFKNVFVNKKKLIRKNEREFAAKGTYEIARSGKDLERIHEGNREGMKKIAFVFTIEGANVFNTDESFERIRDRIKTVKEWVETPVFFISFAHHFNNYLCGHAHSIPDYGGLVMDQSPGMDEGFTEKGIKVLRYLLGIDDENKRREELGRRILIDVKHMSAASRKYYYEQVIDPCRDIHGDRIPIIASHVAYSGVKTLDELILNAPNENDSDGFSTFDKPFNTWNINISDEDVKRVFVSGGIIGVNMDQRILAVPKKDRKGTYPVDYDVNYFWENVKAMMKVVLSSDLPEKEKVVDLFGLGTDFDGYIDPLDSYPTVLEFDDFRAHLTGVIKRDPDSSFLLGRLSPGKFVDKVCYGNAYEFARRYL